MSGVLFLSHRLPFPPNRGDKMRSHHILKALAQLAPVHVGCFAETVEDKACEAELAAVAATYFMPTRHKPLPVAGLEAIVRGEPVNLPAFRHPLLGEWVARTLERYEIDTIFIYSGQMGQYVPSDWHGRLVVDLVDVDSAKYEAYAREKPFPMSWVDGREAKLMAREEARLAGRADRTLLASKAEAALLASRLPAGAVASIVGITNGIDAESYNPTYVVPHPALAEGGPHFVFTGQMDYKPNVDAAVRAIERLMPAIRKVHSDARFHAVGRSPAPELVALEGANGARIWGAVPDVRPFLAAADVVLLPLTIARGIQNKALEAMAMARPVLLSVGAATGIGARDGEHFVTAETDGEFVEQALALLADPEPAARLGAAARRYVVEELSWAATLRGLPEIVGCAPAAKAQRDAA
jgi:sugar transferase (PEP-CTERM/EpsH1 system associated)